jgi:hypothetical protein
VGRGDAMTATQSHYYSTAQDETGCCETNF